LDRCTGCILFLQINGGTGSKINKISPVPGRFYFYKIAGGSHSDINKISPVPGRFYFYKIAGGSRSDINKISHIWTGTGRTYISTKFLAAAGTK
jgi:hypothetical protein